MKNLNVSKEELLRRTTNSLLYENKPIEWPFDMLRFAFGFKRVDGKEYLITKLFRPSATEEDMSYLPKQEIIQNVIDWAKENGFACCYNGNYSMNDSFTFYKLIPKQTQ